MRRFAAPLALATLGGFLACAHGPAAAARSACPTQPPKTYSYKDTRAWELWAAPITLDAFTDAKGNRLHLLGPGQFLAPFPGWNENAFVNGTGSGDETDILFDSGYPNGYAARAHTDGHFPVEIYVHRATPDIELDGSAVWLLFETAPANVTLAYATGAKLSSLRLCVDRGRNGSVDASLPPAGVVEGRAAGDDGWPEFTVDVKADGSGGATFAVNASDSGAGASGLAGVWVFVERSGYQPQRYSRPLSVPADARVAVWVLDRAGNLESGSIDVAARLGQ